MDFLSGLEKFGLSNEGMSLFEEEKKTENENEEQEKEVKAEPTEADFLLDKSVRCPMCEKTFKIKQVKNGRVKRLESDKDLRPRHQYIDTLKYSIQSCPYCGYTGLTRSIGELSGLQRKLIQEKICDKFTGVNEIEEYDVYPYDYAIERYKLALFNSVAKNGKNSEKAYLCLCISWLLRGKIEEMPEEMKEIPSIIDNAKNEEDAYYNQAYEGFLKAISTENFPMVGMEESTVMYLLSVMSYKLGKLDVASKFLSSILTSSAASRRIKDKALDLKNEMIDAIKSGRV
ncbi:MAG: DUF2225 domain-containing protein [Lachnospiraceae bacterium]|nr:DUF2225 domain-containing protein [Lachnospiraceae bacterium]